MQTNSTAELAELELDLTKTNLKMLVWPNPSDTWNLNKLVHWTVHDFREYRLPPQMPVEIPAVLKEKKVHHLPGQQYKDEI